MTARCALLLAAALVIATLVAPVATLARVSSLVARRHAPSMHRKDGSAVAGELEQDTPKDAVTSPEISRLMRKIEEAERQLHSLQSEKELMREQLQKLQEEFGGEIERIKREFARIRSRAYDETRDAVDKAKIDALKEVLPITDSYALASKMFTPLLSDNERKIAATYDQAFQQFLQVLQDYGIERVESVGQPFDFNVMEAIMTAPSTKYAKDVVVAEYQIGYRLGNRCVRPAMVVVSEGPGPG